MFVLVFGVDYSTIYCKRKENVLDLINFYKNMKGLFSFIYKVILWWFCHVPLIMSCFTSCLVCFMSYTSSLSAEYSWCLHQYENLANCRFVLTDHIGKDKNCVCIDKLVSNKLIFLLCSPLWWYCASSFIPCGPWSDSQ